MSNAERSPCKDRYPHGKTNTEYTSYGLCGVWGWIQEVMTIVWYRILAHPPRRRTAIADTHQVVPCLYRGANLDYKVL